MTCGVEALFAGGGVVFYRAVWEAIAMGSLLEELARREAAARKRIEEIRGQIERLQEDLTAGERALSRLVVTRETVQEILGVAAGEPPPAGADPGAPPGGRQVPTSQAPGRSAIRRAW